MTRIPSEMIFKEAPMKKTLTLSLLAILVCALPALAIFGVGDIVYDPSNFSQAVQQLAQLEQQYGQLVRTYEMIESQYELMQQMARQVPVNMATRYKVLATPWTPSAAANTLGTTSGWTEAINNGQNAAAGYSSATQALEKYGNAFGNLSTSQQDHIKSAYATVELTDGANLAGMQTIGNLRGNAAAVETAIRNLENDSLSSDPNMNTEIAVLNKIGAANLINVRNTQDTNKLLVALAEEQIVESKRQRDAEAQAFNNHIRFLSDAQAVMAAQAQDASAAMLAWRMP
jgi:prophage DNA circulation protein